MKRVYAILRAGGWICAFAASVIALRATGKLSLEQLLIVASLFAAWLATAFLPRR